MSYKGQSDAIRLQEDLERTISEEVIGIEYETDTEQSKLQGEDESGEKPFDAEKIRVDQQMLSVKYMLELMDSQMIELDPEYQRHRVWQNNKRKSLLIESLMLRIPIPAFYFYESMDGKYQVIDGQQRLFTIKDFMDGKFKLTGLEYLGNLYENKDINALEQKYIQRIYRTQIAVNVLDARSPHRVIYDIFRRLNTGGVQLSLQEMRNAFCSHEVREFFHKSITDKWYLTATRYKIKELRMDAEEIVLRFYAFYLIYDYENELVNYEHSGIAPLLDKTIDKLNEMNKEKRNEMLKNFSLSMERCYRAFGEYCFSKLQLDENHKYCRKRDYINRSLFTAFSVLLLHPKYDDMDLESKRDIFLQRLAEKLEDHDYFSAISNATGDKKNVIIYFKFSKEVLEI